jgi:hypothetical protein
MRSLERPISSAVAVIILEKRPVVKGTFSVAKGKSK